MKEQISSSPLLGGSQANFALSFGQSENNANVQRVSLTWNELCEKLRQPTIGVKSGPYWCPAIFAGDRRAAGNVEQVHLLVLDVESQDHGQTQPTTPQDCADALERLGLLGCVHTTYSHKPESPRYRVVVVPDRPLRKEELRPASTGLAYLLLGSDYARVCDLKASGDAARLYFLPRVPDVNAQELFHFVSYPGQPVCVDSLIETGTRRQEPSSHGWPAIAQEPAINGWPATAQEPAINGWPAIAEKTNAYGQAALESEVGKVSAAQEGERNNTLHHAAFRMGQLVHDGDLDEKVARDALIQAGIQTGLPRNEVEKTVASGLRGGKQHPRDRSVLLLPTAVEARQRAAVMARDILLSESEAPGIAYPIHALGPLAPVVQSIAYGMQCSLPLAGQSVLAAVALLAQSMHNVRTLESTKPLSLYCLTVAGSGEGKDTADRIALRPIHERQREAARFYRAALQEKKKNDAPPKACFLTTGDITIEGLRSSFQYGLPSQGVYSTEAGVVLTGYAMQPEQRVKTASALCGLWDRGHISVSRVGTGRYEQFGTRLSVHLLGQPAAVTEALQDAKLASIGFWPRFQLAWPDPIPPRKYRPFNPEEDPAIMQYWARMNELLKLEMQDDLDGLPALDMTDQARRTLAAFFEHIEHEARRGVWRAIKPFALRAAELTARVAGVMAVYAAEDSISVERIEQASQLVEYSLENWQAVLDANKRATVASNAYALYGWLLEREGPTSPRDILRLGPPELRSQYARDMAIQRLAAHNLVQWHATGVVAVIPAVIENGLIPSEPSR